MIDGVELAALRADSVDYMPDRVLVYVPTTATSQSGGRKDTFPTTPTHAYDGRLAPMTNTRKAWYADKLGGRQGWTLTVQSDAVVPDTARLGVGARRFQIVGSNAVRSYQITKMFDCVEVL